jgi:UrcA family protein
MRTSLLLSALLLSACVTQGMTTPPPPDIVVTYRDLALKTPAGRAELVRRVDQAVRSFCGAHDPQDKTAIFDPRLARPRRCPGYATLLLLHKSPASVRRAYWEGVAEGRR